MSDSPFDLKQAERWFAVELNNRAWEMVEADELAEADVERMIHAAHAACHHWLVAGNSLNHQRAECLIATAYVKAKFAEAAVRHAGRCLALSRANADAQKAFDRATAHGCAAIADALAGRNGKAHEQHKTARAVAELFDDSSEMSVFNRIYPRPM